MHVFADTRYRLRVNGEFAGAGPGRFVTQHPEFDTYDLAGLLRCGKNTLEVEVNFFGASSYQTMPDGQPGFWAAGGAHGVNLATPGEWTAEVLRAWRPDAPLFSFAQNPVEICDTRLLDRGEPAEIEVCRGSGAPWGPLRPYSGTPLEFPHQEPSRIVLAGRLDQGERRYYFMSHNAASGPTAVKPWVAFATWILARQPGAVKVGCGWSELFLNGRRVAAKENVRFSNHCICDLDLRRGWNLLAGKACILSEYWAYGLAVPEDAGVSLHARRDERCADIFAISPPSKDKDLLVLPESGAVEAPGGWRTENGAPPNLTPARAMAWDVVARDAVRDVDFSRWADVSHIEGREATWCMEFSGDCLGYAILDAEAPPGTVLDVAFSDWLVASGGIAFYQSNPFLDSAERFILRGGRQRVELFHPRGGKFLQVTMRAPAEPAALALRGVQVRLRRTQHRDRTSFRCGEPAIDWMWPATMRTLLCSTDEAYLDCPWRERGSYIGDALVSVHLDHVLHADPRTSRRCLRQFAQAALPDGQLACCAPSWLRQPHEDYTLLWILALHDHWSLGGDLATVEELWPTVEGVWASPSWTAGASGLWNLHGRRQFVDWGVRESEREGDANATINLFRLAALRATAGMAEAMGRAASAADYRTQAAQVESALFDVLWDDDRGCLRASGGAATDALHANVLALCFSAGPGELRSRIVDYIEPRVLGNLARALRGKPHAGHLELYFLTYLLPGLAAHDRPDLAEHVLATHYGHLHASGHDTLPESLAGLVKGGESRCHPWSGAGTVYAARHILGIRPEQAGDPDSLVCAPLVHGIRRASGRIAHPRGWIEVQWEGEGTLPDVRAPQGVHVHRHAVRRTGKAEHAVVAAAC